MKLISKYISANFFLLFITLGAIFLKVNDIGLLLKNKIVLDNTLDFSWQSDSVERLLHGFILGKDFVFTYGPLFQLLISLPSLLLHVPSYLSVELAPLVYMVLNLTLLLLIIKLLGTRQKEQPILFAYLLFVVGLLAVDQLLLLRILLPLSYGLLLFTYIGNVKKVSHWSWLLCIVPSLLGLITYDVFISCLLLIIVIFIFAFFTQPHSRRRQNIIIYGLYILIVLLIQVFVSFLLTHSFDYIIYSLDTLKNYYFLLNTAWSKDPSNILFFFPIILLCLIPYIYFAKRLSLQQKLLLFVLLIASVLEIKSAFIRSDSGHIIKAIYPSIITIFICIYFIARERKELLFLGCVLFLFIPYKPMYFDTINIKNLIELANVIQHKPSFTTLFTFPTNYYYSRSDITTLESLISKNKGSILIYPYDNYLLNISDTTYNTFTLQLYGYSNSVTEKEVVRKLEQNPPKYILLGVDGKGALPLDQIPNLTRNPLFAQFILQHYAAVIVKPNYIILHYESAKSVIQTISSKNACIVYTVQLPVHESIIEKVLANFLKSPLYYLQTKSSYFRIPYTPTAKNYLIFENDENAKQLASLFDSKKNSIPHTSRKQLTVIRQSPFLHRKTVIEKGEFPVMCLQ